MPLTKDEIKTLHDTGYSANQSTREKAADDIVFALLTQWDDNMTLESQLAFRGQFDITRKAIRGILSQLAANPVQVDFVPIDEDREDAADLLDGKYRADNQNNMSIEARANASQEMVISGFGAWEMFTEYESVRGDSNNQVIKRRPIPEANNTSFCDPNAKLLDKSDAMWWSILTGYTEDGYKTLVEELTGEEKDDINPSNFGAPQESYVFPWIDSGSQTIIYVSTFYYKELVETKILNMVDPLGQQKTLYEDDLKDVIDDMIDEGYVIESDKTIKKWRVTKYIVSGEEILNGEIDSETEERVGEVIAGEHCPIIPIYGEHAIVEGQEHWEGVVRLAKDPQRLHNFVLSYLADISSRSPRQKPMLDPAQVLGFEGDYSLSGAENNLPYLRKHLLDENGRPFPVGPVDMLPETPIPPALPMIVELTRQSVEDVANPGMTQDVADPDISGKAVLAIQSRIDMQSMIYLDHTKHAERYDGVVYASMASEINDVPRTVIVELPNGIRKKVKQMEQVIDSETGDLVTLNDIYDVEFQVYSKIGPSFSSQKEQTLERLQVMLQGINPADPKYDMLLLQYLSLMDGSNFDDIRDYVRDQQLMLGFRKPEDKEEEQKLEEAKNQPKEPNADMLLAMGENKKGDAALMTAKLAEAKLQLEFQNKNTGNEIKAFDAQTKRMQAQIDALEADATVNMKNIESFGKQIENKANLKEIMQPSLMTDEELMTELRG